MPAKTSTPLQARLAKATAWTPADVAALFVESSTDALPFLATLAEARSLVGSTKAYKTLVPLLSYLLERPTGDIEPLVPLLRELCSFVGYDPGGTRQYELVRNHAMRLLARRKDPAARALIERFIDAFPERRDQTYAVSLVAVMGEASIDLGAPELEPTLRALLDTMLLAYSPKQRGAALAVAVAALDRLAQVGGAAELAHPPVDAGASVRGRADSGTGHRDGARRSRSRAQRQ